MAMSNLDICFGNGTLKKVEKLASLMTYQNNLVWAIEELSELTQELCKSLRNNKKFSTKSLREEVGDVLLNTILFEQRLGLEIMENGKSIEYNKNSDIITVIANLSTSSLLLTTELTHHIKMSSLPNNLQIPTHDMLLHGCSIIRTSLLFIINEFELDIDDIISEIKTTISDKLKKIERVSKINIGMADPY